MASLGVKLPLRISSKDGFMMTKNIKSMFRQNLKMLILTSPGERVMEPSFGVGLRNVLFENFDAALMDRVNSRIREQVKIYMPSISVVEILFDTSKVDSNTLGVKLVYSIPAIGIKDLLQITI